MFLVLLRELEREGRIKPGDVLCETTSGSAGISFAWMCRKLGYRSVVFAPDCIPLARKVEIENLADEYYYSQDDGAYLAASAEMMRNYLRHSRWKFRAWSPNHSQDPRTLQAFTALTNEVIKRVTPIHYFIGGIGNGSTLLAIGRRLKNHRTLRRFHCKILGFEPRSACPYYQTHRDRWGKVIPLFARDEDIPQKYSFHSLPGTGSFGNIRFPFMEMALAENILDDVCIIPDSLIPLANTAYNADLQPEEHQGNSSLVARYIAEEMALYVENKNFKWWV